MKALAHDPVWYQTTRPCVSMLKSNLSEALTMGSKQRLLLRDLDVLSWPSSNHLDRRFLESKPKAAGRLAMLERPM